MNGFLIILVVLFIWWLCGLLNVAIFQIYGTPYRDFDPSWYRTQTLTLCFGFGPITTIIAVIVLLTLQPVKLGTRWGRYLGRKINPDNDD